MTDHTFTNIEIAADAKLHHATRGKAERLDAMLKAEYPRITLVAEVDEDTDKVIGWSGYYADPEEGRIDLTETEKLPEIADLIEACQAQDLDPEAGSGPVRSGSVVDETYRQQYRERSTNGQTCGDWLAERLVQLTHTTEGFNFEDFENILSTNGVDLTAKWAQITRGRGWQGRYRMNGRQVLEKKVAWTGILRDHQGNAEEVPADALAALRGKHEKWIAKEEKRLAKEAAKAEAAEAEAK